MSTNLRFRELKQSCQFSLAIDVTHPAMRQYDLHCPSQLRLPILHLQMHLPKGSAAEDALCPPYLRHEYFAQASRNIRDSMDFNDAVWIDCRVESAVVQVRDMRHVFGSVAASLSFGIDNKDSKAVGGSAALAMKISVCPFLI
jgi:hypothetical protein